MDRAQLYKLTELIVAEVVRRIAQEERRRQHPEQVLVLLADSVSFPEKLQQTLNEQFGVAYTPVSIPETNTFADEALLYAGKLEPGGLLERVKEAKTVILVSPRLELLRRIASGDDAVASARARHSVAEGCPGVSRLRAAPLPPQYLPRGHG